MPENFIDFRAVKQMVSITSVLDHYRIELRKVKPNSLRGLCPLPTHTSEKSKESFGVNTAKNIWACQSNSCASARAGKKGGNILDLVSIMESCSIREAAEKVQQWFDSTSATGQPKTRTQSRPKTDGTPAAEKKDELVAGKEGSGCAEKGGGEKNKPLTFTLKDVDSTHPYLKSRGIKEEVARHFGVGFFPGRGSMQGRVVIPISNARGELVAYAGRAIDGSEPKYKLPAGFHKSAELFNFHRTVEKDERVILVEGFFDAMKVHQAGFPNVVALMGSSLSEVQETLLQKFGSIIIFLDGDAAGREAAKLIGARLMRAHFVKVTSLPEGKQPDKLSSDEIRKYLDW